MKRDAARRFGDADLCIHRAVGVTLLRCHHFAAFNVMATPRVVAGISSLDNFCATIFSRLRMRRRSRARARITASSPAFGFARAAFLGVACWFFISFRVAASWRRLRLCAAGGSYFNHWDVRERFSHFTLRR